jgi:metallophosphoesterase (TIGR00282 family)
VRILFIGDVMGKPGRKAVRELLPRLKAELEIDFTLANGENLAGGIGLTRKVVLEMMNYGIDVLTTGNHVFDKSEAFEFIDEYEWLLRPANYPPGVPGRGMGMYMSETGVEICVINLVGRLFTGHFDCPFRTADRLLESAPTAIKIVDFHAETTSEKGALAHYLDGRVSAVIGTHTHIQTSDWRIMKKGTAFITDVGMAGGFDSVIGVKPELALRRFLHQLPAKGEPSRESVMMEGVFLDIDPATGRTSEIKGIRRFVE